MLVGSRVCVGVLAHNEARGIGAMIGRLVEQSLLRDASRAVDVVVLANGCSDATVERAVGACEGLSRVGSGLVANLRVVEIKERVGKVGAWNAFVHRLSGDADVLVLVDADVSFSSVDHLLEGVQVLEANPEAQIAAPWAERVISGRTLLSRVAGASSNFSFDDTAMCGQSYTLRADVARKLTLPTGVLDDGFIKAMVVTDMFTRSDPDILNRFVRLATSVRYVPETTIRGLFTHETSLTVGMSVNAYLFELFDHQRRTATTFNAADWLREQAEGDSDWFSKFMKGEIDTRGWRCVPAGVRNRRIYRSKMLPVVRRLKRLPLTVGAWVFDQLVVLKATHILRTGRGMSYWKGAQMDGQAHGAIGTEVFNSRAVTT